MSLESKLKKRANRIDWIDGFLGPTTALMYLSGSEFLHQTALVLSIAELALFKVPFVLSYIGATNDVKSLLYWVPKEIFANSSPIGGFLDIIPTYSLRVNYHLNARK